VQIAAHRVDVGEADVPLPDAGRRLLLGADCDDTAVGTYKHRRVRLACGDHVLSEADNWYLPECLTPDQNRQLEETDTPFGVVVRVLGFRRRTLSSRLSTSPSGTCGHASIGAELPTATPAAHVLQHTAVLSTAQGRPFSYLVERYTGEALSFPKQSHHDSRSGSRSSVDDACDVTPHASRSGSDRSGAE